MYACINTECCSQVQILVTSRMTVLTVSCIVGAIFLLMFVINSQYMVKVMARFSTRWLNHRGDLLYCGPFVILLGAFFFLRYGFSFDQNGPPIVNFPPIVPKNTAIYSYYGVPNPKQRKELQLLVPSNDQMLSSFSF